MTFLAEIPIEVLLDNFLPWLAIPDLLHLGSTNRFFTSLCNDETFWKRKLQADFNYSDESTARISGWKLIYKGLSRPRSFVWGESSKGRLGLNKFPRSNIGDVPFPTELHIARGVRIVSLSAAGMSFFALDSEGRVYVWGTLDGTSFALLGDGYNEAGQKAMTPLKLKLPSATRSISCGRLHATTLDENSDVWIFLSWGHPFRLCSPYLDKSSEDTTPLQVTSGWRFSAVLTMSGNVLIWRPFDNEIQERVAVENGQMTDLGIKILAVDDIIQCKTWDLTTSPFRLPEVPRLPPLGGASADEPVQIIKIAALENGLIGLTNQGHVLKFSVTGGLQAAHERWEYLPNFSEIEKIKDHTAYASDLKPPRTLRITHISAQYRTFVAYSPGPESVVLMGSGDAHEHFQPTILPTLQNKDIISVVLGDYHFGALTSTGKLLTWGAYSRGALGLGDPTKIEPGEPGGYRTEQIRSTAASNGGPYPTEVRDPSEVTFDHGEKTKRKRFCFAATAAGWHMGALVIDLEPDTDEKVDNEEDTRPIPGQFPASQQPGPSSGYPQEPGRWGFPFSPSTSIFRVGFAGRGAQRGGNRGSGRGS
ncbi:regulator of chromosome condensation 1/beta-lactamase-inhibitor protein II [Hygrophoropsis aurantiaca]|uniref:Regulator of chromosome condensation 1/beta-lactamase-inhibitor protein II n=1 Tax=Hygrophoropsis aurantiaca TaxID=72124 RepID=A0ACB8AJV7_9AGAM|nr:regulator of chromosome condensation 1/beta-lactamase-inhibitor protein II [Hygrophoropsis aurantiaca]